MIGRFVVALSFLLAPLLAVAAATATTAHLQAVAESEAAERSRTHAVLLEDAPAPDTGEHATTASIRPGPCRCGPTWPVADGTSREGTVLVPPRTPVGTAVPVWVNRQGNPTRAPLDRAGIPGSAAATGALALIGVPMADLDPLRVPVPGPGRAPGTTVGTGLGRGRAGLELPAALAGPGGQPAGCRGRRDGRRVGLLLGLDGIQGRDEGLDRDVAGGHELATGAA